MNSTYFMVVTYTDGHQSTLESSGKGTAFIDTVPKANTENNSARQGWEGHFRGHSNKSSQGISKGLWLGMQLLSFRHR